MEEVFKDMAGFEEYVEVSNYGRVYIKARDYIHPYRGDVRKAGGIFPKIQNDKDGYRQVNIGINGEQFTIKVHRKVMETFEPIDENRQVNHKDGNKANNRISNLEWVTPKENMEHALATGLITVKEKEYKYCGVCSDKFEYELTIREKYCSKECGNIGRRKVKERPEKEELYQVLKSTPFVRVGDMYGVSDNAVRKWCKTYNIPSKSSYYRIKYRT